MSNSPNSNCKLYFFPIAGKGSVKKILNAGFLVWHFSLPEFFFEGFTYEIKCSKQKMSIFKINVLAKVVKVPPCCNKIIYLKNIYIYLKLLNIRLNSVNSVCIVGQQFFSLWKTLFWFTNHFHFMHFWKHANMTSRWMQKSSILRELILWRCFS